MASKERRNLLNTALTIILLFLSAHTSARETNYNITKVLDDIFSNGHYDRRLRPLFNGPPVNVTIGFWLLSLDNIDVLNMDYVVDIYLRQEWTDTRLDIGRKDFITLSSAIRKQVWVPDTYFVNSKEGKFHQVTVDNSFFMLGPGGRVKLNSRLTIKAACTMNLRMFPMDKQLCPLIMESYGYSSVDITYQWEADGEKTFVPSTIRQLSQFDLLGLVLSHTNTEYIAGNWSGLSASFILERKSSYFFLNLYAPCALIVLMSWMSFYLPYEQYPARIALGVTAVLTTVTILSMFNNTMPKVNYVKYVDHYLIGCFGFVFASLFEYYIVLTVARGARKRSQQKRKPDITKESRISRGVSMELEISYPNGGRFCSFLDPIREKIYRDAFITKVDDASKYLFLTAFILFNCIYWTMMLNEKSLET